MSPGSCGCCKNCCNPRPARGATPLRCGGWRVCRFGRASSPARCPPRRRSRNPVCGFGWISPPVRRPDFSLTSGRTAWPWPATRARAGATVLGIDISPEAVAAATEHARLNELADRCTFQAGNAFDVLRALAKEAPRFDVVILDPPAFAPRKSAVAQAAAGYKEINLRALKVLRPAGILVSCSCSYHVSEELLLALIAEAAQDAHRRLRLLEARTQARDHPIHPGMPETRYLKCLILEVT